MLVFLLNQFYDLSNPLPVTYGSMGSVTGHEFFHSISAEKIEEMKDTGTNIDETSLDTYKKFSSCLIKLYEQFGLNGTKTVTENFSDWFGIRAAFKAMQKLESESHDERSKIMENLGKYPGLGQFSPEQLFFISFAQSMNAVYVSTNITSHSALTGSHSPHWARVNVILSNMPEFRDVFGCRVGDRMFMPETCQMWD